MKALHRQPNLRYSHGFDLVDANGVVLDSLDTLHDPADPPHVAHDNTNTTPGTCGFNIVDALTWGADLVAPWIELSSSFYSDGEHFRFPLGVYVATSPSMPLDNGTYSVLGYDKVYLLKSDVGDTFTVKPGDNYSERVSKLLDMAGIAGARLAGQLNTAVVNAPGDWITKTHPNDGSVAPMIFPSDDSNDYQYIDIINAILSNSGCTTLFTDQLGRFSIAEIVKPETARPLWDFARTDVGTKTPDFAWTQNVVKQSSTYESDLWGVPNQLVFIRTGLTFDPIEGSGQYTINNGARDNTGVLLDPAHYRPPSDQGTIRRIVRSVQHLDASSQADLVKQAEKIYTDTFSDAERFDWKSAPWPCAWHLDVMRFYDKTLPRTAGRKVRAKSWDMPLDGQDMSWAASVVSDVQT